MREQRFQETQTLATSVVFFGSAQRGALEKEVPFEVAVLYRGPAQPGERRIEVSNGCLEKKNITHFSKNF